MGKTISISISDYAERRIGREIPKDLKNKSGWFESLILEALDQRKLEYNGEEKKTRLFDNKAQREFETRNPFNSCTASC